MSRIWSTAARFCRKRRSPPHVKHCDKSIGAFDQLVLEERRDRLQPGDILLLCSDGLSSALRDAEMAHILTGSPLAAASRSTDRAGARSRRTDNVKRLVVEYTK